MTIKERARGLVIVIPIAVRQYFQETPEDKFNSDGYKEWLKKHELKFLHARESAVNDLEAVEKNERRRCSDIVQKTCVCNMKGTCQACALADKIMEEPK